MIILESMERKTKYYSPIQYLRVDVWFQTDIWIKFEWIDTMHVFSPTYFNIKALWKYITKEDVMDKVELDLQNFVIR